LTGGSCNNGYAKLVVPDLVTVVLARSHRPEFHEVIEQRHEFGVHKRQIIDLGTRDCASVPG